MSHRRYLRYWRSIAASIIALGVMTGTASAATATPAAVWSGNAYIANYSFYINDEGCRIASGNPILVDANVGTFCELFHFENIGTVSSSNAWPFTPGSGLNTEWNGHEVSQIIYYPLNSNSGYSIAASRNFLNAVLHSTSSQTYAVQDYISSNNYKLISVDSSNHFNQTMFFTVTDCHGCQVNYATSGKEWTLTT
jgi:hypothetical protein